MHLEVIERVLAYAGSIGFEVLDLDFSPIRGPEGNIEYLAYLKNHREGEVWEQVPVIPSSVVEQAHEAL